MFISFSQAYYEITVNAVGRNNPKSFTYWDVVQGRGSKTGEPHYCNHAWSILSPAILTMAEGEKVDHFLEVLHNLDRGTETQGFRAFVWSTKKTT